MIRALALAALAAALNGCVAPAPAPADSAAPASPPPTDLGSTPTPVPIHVVTKASGARFVEIVERVPAPPGPPRIAYELRALASEGDFGGATAGTAEVQQPHVIFHDPKGGRMLADAPKATVMQQDKSVFMTGGVHAQSQDGTTLTCDTLRYFGRTGRIHGEGHVMLTAPNGVRLPGDRIDADVRLENVQVSKGRS